MSGGGEHAVVAPLVESRVDEGSAALEQRMHALGYLFFPGLLLPRDVLRLRDVVLAYAERSGWLDPAVPTASATHVPGLGMGAYDDPRWIELLQDVLPHEAFRSLRAYPSLLCAVACALGGTIEPGIGDICRVVSADDPAHTTPPHQDAQYVRGDGAELATAWLPLNNPCPLALGPLAILPGSHVAGLRPHHGEGLGAQGCSVPGDAVWHASDLECGDVLVFGGLTVHRALPNRSPRTLRLSAELRFRRSKVLASP